MDEEPKLPTAMGDLSNLARNLQSVPTWEIEGSDVVGKSGTLGQCRAVAGKFVALIALGLTPAGAARQLGVSRHGMYMLRKRWPQFRDAWAEAEPCGVEFLEDTAWHRAVIGTPKGIYHKGTCIAVERQVDNRVLMRLLEARSAKYAKKIDVDVTINIAERIIAARKRTGITYQREPQTPINELDELLS